VALGVGGFTPGKFAQSDMANHFASLTTLKRPALYVLREFRHRI
jgi:hypothetical protein